LVDAVFFKRVGLVEAAHFEVEDCFALPADGLEVGVRPAMALSSRWQATSSSGMTGSYKKFLSCCFATPLLCCGASNLDPPTTLRVATGLGLPLGVALGRSRSPLALLALLRHGGWKCEYVTKFAA
jgi:hypothetical protein